MTEQEPTYIVITDHTTGIKTKTEIKTPVAMRKDEGTNEMQYRTDSEGRKAMPVYSGVLRYFPAALYLVSIVSRKGNDKHNPGEPLHHARGKSMDHGDALTRHQLEVGTIDPDVGLDHAAMVAWRALAQLQELAEEKYGWPLAPGARVERERKV